jgi:tetratricopeptide (TPR) repeat protein
MKKEKTITSQVVNKLKLEVLQDIDMLPHDKVLPKLEALYNNNPKDVVTLKALAHIYYHKKYYAKAMHYILNALDISPNDAQALKYKAWIYDETGDRLHAMKTLWEIVDAGEADGEVYDQLGAMEEQDGNFLVGLGSYTRAIQDPNYLQTMHAAIGGANCYSKAGAFEIADEIYDTLLDVSPGYWLILHNKANNLYLKGDLDKAEIILLEIISKDPHCEISKLLLEDIKKKKNELFLLQNAKEDFRGKELKYPGNNSIYINDVDSSLNLFDSPEELDALLHNSQDLQEKGDFKGAKNILETIIKIDDSIAVVWLYLANLHYQLLEIPEAINCCDKVLTLLKDMNDNSKSGTLMIKARSLHALGKLDEALAIADDIISTDPSKYIPIIIKARINNRKGDYTGALNILLPAMNMIPQETELAGFAHYLLATAYYKLGNETEYIKALYESYRLGCEFGTRWFRVKYIAVEGTLGDLLN